MDAVVEVLVVRGHEEGEREPDAESGLACPASDSYRLQV